MKRVLTLLCTGLLVLAVSTGCTKKSEAAQGQGAKDAKMTIGMSAINLTDAGLVLIREGAEYAAQDYNCELIWKACDGNLDTQIDVIRGFIQQGVDAIWIDSVDVDGIAPIVSEITDAGIIAMTAGSKVNARGNYNPIYPDYDDTYFAGRVVGEYYKTRPGTIGLIVAMAGSMISEKRQQGFSEAIAMYPNLKLVIEQGRWDANVAMQKAEDIIRANSDLLHMHVIADGMSYGAYRAVQNTGAKITMSSSDGESDALRYMEEGTYILDNLVGNGRLGYWGVALLRRIYDGETMALDQYLPTYKIMGDGVRKIAEDAGFQTLNSVGYKFITIDEARKLGAPESYRVEFGPGPNFVPMK
jgi:ribose transport system substrate-binding protein